MKTKLLVLILSAIFALLYLFQLGHPAETAIAQITFVQTPAQQRPQGQGQSGQPGLSPEKKRSLSKYGPEDAFPGAREQENNQRRSNRTAPPRQSISAPQPSPTIKPASSPAITPSTVAAAAPTPQTPAPLATVAASTDNNKSQTGKSGASVLVPVTLSAAMLLVFGALIYVVGMLRKKLKQEN